MNVAKIEMLRLLHDDGEEGRLGIEMAALSAPKLRTMHGLLEQELVTIQPGWSGTFWFALTRRGQFIARLINTDFESILNKPNSD